MVVFDANGLEGLYGLPESLAHAVERAIGIPGNIAIASNPDAAVHAERGIAGVTVIPPGKEASVLAPLPLYLLGGSEDLALSLDLWGIRTFGEFAALPAIGVAARLGDEGIHLQRLAAGAGFRCLRVAKDELAFDAEMELDSPIELLDFPLLRLPAIARRSAWQISARLPLDERSPGETRFGTRAGSRHDAAVPRADDLVQRSNEDAVSGAERKSATNGGAQSLHSC